MNFITADYNQKPHWYFSEAKKPFVDDLPINPMGRLLEVGCGTGETCQYALQQEKCGWCCGIELDERAAAGAKAKLQDVIIGDVEKIEIRYPEEYFDVLIMIEVLEHLVEPWSVLSKLYRFLKPGALIRSSSPNVAHYAILLMLLRGRWDLVPAGIMDSTHLRWFTPLTYRWMFESCGYVVDSVGSNSALGPKARLLSTLTAGRLDYLLHRGIYMKARRP